MEKVLKRGDLFYVLSELGASEETLDLAESLLDSGLVSSTTGFVGYRDETGCVHVYPAKKLIQDYPEQPDAAE